MVSEITLTSIGDAEVFNDSVLELDELNFVLLMSTRVATSGDNHHSF